MAWGTGPEGLGTAYCGQFLVVRDCGLLWTVFSGEGLWLTVDSFQW